MLSPVHFSKMLEATCTETLQVASWTRLQRKNIIFKKQIGIPNSGTIAGNRETQETSFLNLKVLFCFVLSIHFTHPLVPLRSVFPYQVLNDIFRRLRKVSASQLSHSKQPEPGPVDCTRKRLKCPLSVPVPKCFAEERVEEQTRVPFWADRGLEARPLLGRPWSEQKNPCNERKQSSRVRCMGRCEITPSHGWVRAGHTENCLRHNHNLLGRKERELGEQESINYRTRTTPLD